MHHDQTAPKGEQSDLGPYGLQYVPEETADDNYSE